MSIRFLHIADVHIGMENYGRLDPSTGLHTRVQDFVRCLRWALDAAIREKVDLVILAGDAYKTCDPSPTHQREFAAQIRTVTDVGIPVVMVVGNHDNPVAFGRASSIDIFETLRTERVHVIEKPQILRLETQSGPIQIAGLPWPTRSLLMTKEEYRSLSEEELTKRIQEICAHIIEDFADELDPDVPAVLAAHVTAAGAVFSGSERSALIGRDPFVLTSVLANPRFDYVALGHVHRFQDLNAGGRPPVVYPGSIERVDFGEEKETKGFCIVCVEEEEGEEGSLSLFPDRPSGAVGSNRRTSYRFVEVPARRFVTVEVAVEEEEDPTEAVLRGIEERKVEGAVVRIMYRVGEGLQGGLDLRRIHAALEGAFLVSSIVPRMELPERVRRAEISEDLAVVEALDRYIESNPDLEPLREELERRAKDLEEEWEQERRGQRRG